MGHLHLSVLPRTTRWRAVVDLLTAGAADAEVVSSSARAAENDLLSATRGPGYVEAVRLLLAVPHAARSDDFARSLRDAGLDVGQAPSLLDLTSAMTERLDETRRASSDRSDLGELAGRALISTVSLTVGDSLPGLFDATPGDVQAEVRKLSWSRGISSLSRAFYARLVAGSLSYWLDRTLALQLGPGGRFKDVSDRSAFDLAVAHHAMEATRIIEEFASGWYGKTLHRKGKFTSHDATVFGAVALKKIVEELRMKRGTDA